MEGGVGFSTDGDRPGFTTKGSSYSFGCARCPFVLEGARLGDDLSEMFAEALAEGPAETSRLEGGGEEIVEAVKLGLVDEDEGCDACDDCARADARDAAAISALRLSHTLT